MRDYHFIITSAVSSFPSTADEAKHAIYEQARTALHERLGNGPQISDTDLVNEHFRLEAAIYEVEEDFVTEGYAPVCERRDGLYVKDKGLHTLGPASLVGEAERVPVCHHSKAVMFDLLALTPKFACRRLPNLVEG
jgi:hypothetical protein